MEHGDFLPQLVAVLGLGVIAALGVAFLRLPAVAGFMVAGTVASATGIVTDKHSVDLLAEIGVVLLLFTIGLEFSLERLRRIWRLVVIGGALQVGLTTLATVGVSMALGETFSRGVFFGFLVALSSTAIVLRGLTERGEVDAPHGRFTIGALIFQDLCVVPMMLLIPVLGGKGGDNPALAIAIAMGKAAVFVVATLVGGRFVLPRVLQRVDLTRSREVFLLAVLVVCAGIAGLTAAFGLSLALGAFLAGMLLSDTAYGQRAMANVLPLRDVLTSLFFMSLGMLFDLRVVIEQPTLVGLIFVGMFFVKGLIATVASIAMKFPARVAWLAGVSLAQFGEFGFVLAKEGEKVSLLSPYESSVLLAAGLLTMFVTPVSMRLAPHFAAGAQLLRPLERLLGARGIDERTAQDEKLSGHVIVAGHGLGGTLLIEALRSANIPFIGIDLDAEAVRAARLRREPVYYGDATSDEVLEHANLARAAVLVLLISDDDATRRAVAVARQVAPHVPILVRARRFADAAGFIQMGATDVVSEELEAGIEMIARVLRVKSVPINVLGPIVASARDGRGEGARRIVVPRARLGESRLLDQLKVEPVLLGDNSYAVGKTLGALELRRHTGAAALAVERGGALVEDVGADSTVQAGDVLWLAGGRDAVYRAVRFLQSGPGDVSLAPVTDPPSL
ncbi:MAG: cation:proton antiporter [Deltaproteobacteria bacterium]|nr:cation:proton antiporter [Deltaproteobacteria bacterium]